ncbi:hypothetical protein [Synechococcus phage MA10]
MKTYLLTNIETGDTYVGTTRQDLLQRLYNHRGRSRGGKYDHTPLYGNMKEYGSHNFKIELLAEGDREEEFISKLKPTLNTDHDGKGRNRNHEQQVKASRKRMRPVICVETGVVYESAAQAAKELGLFPNKITMTCQGKQKSYKKLHWEYAK